MSTYGLPRQVITFLRHLEAYRELLKWDISEGTHKITLTLCWNFHKRGVRESLWAKLQRTLRLRHSDNNNASIPQDLSRFLESSPRRSRKSSSFGRPLSWARISSISLPSRWRHQQSPAPFHRGSPSRLSLPVSPSRHSWHGAAQGSTPSDNLDPPHGTPVTSTPDSIRSPSLSPSHAKISYRSEDELAESMENLARQFRDENQKELKSIRREWDAAIENWPAIASVPDVNTSSEPTDNSEENINLQRVNDTVQRCLQTCDSILDKHSTLIL